MSHTNVDSGAKKGIVVNFAEAYVDEEDRQIKTPAGGRDIKSNDIEKDFVEIPVQDGEMLKDDSGKPVAIGSKVEIMAKAQKAKIESGMEK